MSIPDRVARPRDRTRLNPVFADPSGRRERGLQVLAVVSGAILLLVSAFFTLSLIAVPTLPHLDGLGAEVRRAVRPVLPKRPARARMLAAHERKDLMKQIEKDERAHPAPSRTVPPLPRAASPIISGAFYAPWQESGIHSLRANADRISHLFPVWLRLDPEGGLDTRDWDPGLTPRNIDVLQICREHHIAVHPVL